MTKEKLKNFFINRNFLRLSVGEVISETGDMIFNTIIVIWIVQLLNSPTLVSALFISEAIPFVLFGALIGALVERLNKRKTMILADIVRAIVLIPLLLLSPSHFLFAPYILITAFTMSVFSRFSIPAKIILMKYLVPEKELNKANSISQTGSNLAFLLGPLIGSSLYITVGPKIGILVNLISYILSGYLCWKIKYREPNTSLGKMSAKNVITDFKQGSLYIVKEKVIRNIMISYLIAMLGAGAINVLEVFFIRENFGLSEDKLGIFLSLNGVGLVIGSMFFGFLNKFLETKKVIIFGFFLMSTSLIIYSQLTWVIPAFFVICLIGVGNGLLNVGTTSFIISYTPDDLLGRVISTLQSGAYSFSLISMGISGVLANLFETSYIFLGFSLLMLIGSFFSITIIKKTIEVKVDDYDLAKRS